MKLLCKIGLHVWPKQPEHREPVRSKGVHFAFSTLGVQLGLRRCAVCSAPQNCYREGWVGLGGSAGRWKRCSPARKAAIECLPVL